MAGKGSASWWGWLVLVVGVLFLLVDWGLWSFFGVSWWSAALVLWGLKEVL